MNKIKNKKQNKSNKKLKSQKINNNYNGEIINDKRFKHVHNDPRFIKVPQNIRKTTIDSRFKRMFTDDQFKTNIKVDKYGNSLDNEDNNDVEIKKFYRLEEEEEEKDSNNNSNNDIKNKESLLNNVNNISSISDDSSDESESESDEDININMDNLVDEETLERIRSQLVKVDNIKLMDLEDATKRLAVVNLEWSQITSTDLLVLFQSFLQGTGANIKSVRVYPSDYGIKRLKQERDHGPKELFEADRKLKEEKRKKMKELGMDMKNNEKDDKLDTELLRAYEKDRQKYYYAVLECDSIDTAKRLYTECDGLEFERSSNVLDLRFIPDDVVFDHEPRDIATDIPANYEAPNFYSASLQKTNLELSWDNDEPTRDRIFSQLARGVEVRDVDLAAYLGSDGEDSAEGTDAILSLSEESDDNNSNSNSDSDDRGEQMKKGRKKVVLKRRARNRFESILSTLNSSKNEEEEDEGEDIEIVFEPGLKSIGEEIVKKAQANEKNNSKDSESVWDSYLRKRREKRREKRKLKKQKENNEESDENETDIKDSLFEDDDVDEDTIMNDPFFATSLNETDSRNTRKDTKNKTNKKKRKYDDKLKEEEKKKEADALALLVDDNPTVGEYNLKDLVKEHKKKKKQKKRKRNKVEERNEDGYEFNVNDSRFAALYSDSKYHLDPTNPEFKDTAVSETIVQERQKRRKTKKDKNRSKEYKKNNDRSIDSLVNSIKQKAKHLSKRK